MDELYVVVGTCGEYSDRSEWLVCWFDTEHAARDFAAGAKRVADDLVATGVDRWEMSHPINPGFRSDYTGTDYTVARVPRGKAVEL